MKIVVFGAGIPGLGAATRCEQAAHPTTPRLLYAA